LVLFRQEAGRRAREQAEQNGGTRRDQHEPEQRYAHKAAHDRCVAVSDVVDTPQYPPHRAALWATVTQQYRAQRRR
jgi:hypothetical protein